MPDGNLDFLGRNDFQVKIRGYRIELGEIETALTKVEGIQQVVVIDRQKQGNISLAAYIVPTTDAINEESLREALLKQLPDYMVPATFTMITAVPLTINGKVDRKLLPEPEAINTENYTAPNNEIEAQLCQTWEEVLGIDKIGIHDNFFRIGGDSIVSIQLVSRLRQKEFTLSVKDIFEAPTVAQLAILLETKSAEQAKIDAEQGELTGEFELLPIQQRFFEQAYPKPKHWNQAFTIKIPAHLSKEKIEETLEALAKQHDILRSSIIDSENKLKQCYHATSEKTQAPLQTVDVSTLSEEGLFDLLTTWQGGFDFKEGPLWQAAHLTGFEDGSAGLFFAFHHLIIDVVSWRIIIEDLKLLLTDKPLLPKTSSYRQWVDAVKNYGKEHSDEVYYWKYMLENQAELPKPDKQQWGKVELSETSTTQLLRQANQGYNTEINDLLMSALNITLQKVFEQSSNTITLEGHGRELPNVNLDVTQTVGWFTTLYPLKLEGRDDIGATIVATKEALRNIPNKGIGFGALKQQGEFKSSTLPAITFNYLGQLDNTSNTTQQNNWQIAPGIIGRSIATENVEDLLLNINGSIKNGQLRFSIDSKLSAERTTHFSESFKSALEVVIAEGVRMAELGGKLTPSDYSVEDLTIEHLEKLEDKYNIEAIYAATSLQQGFLFHHLNQPNDDAYRVQLIFNYHTALDIQLYQKAWSLASERFPILRTGFDWEEGLLQIVTKAPGITPLNFTLKDISELPLEEHKNEIEKIQKEERLIPFDLSEPGLIRFTIIKQETELYTVLLTEHHSVADGWSGPVLHGTVYQYYDALKEGKQPVIVPEVAYHKAQEYYLKEKTNTETFWGEAKKKWGEANDIRFMLSQSVDLQGVKEIVNPLENEIAIEGEAFQELKSMCKSNGLTLNVALQFAWHKLLQTYTNDDQTIVGSVVSGRDIPVDGIESSVGLYINTLPLVVDWEQEASNLQMMQTIQKGIVSLNSHSSVALSKLQENGERLFHTLFVFENYPTGQKGDGTYKGLGSKVQFLVGKEKSDYPISLLAYEVNEGLHVRLNSGEDWLNQKQANRLLSQLASILATISTNPEEEHQEISLLTNEELETVQHTWNKTDKEYPLDKTLHGLFEEQVENLPENIALVFEKEQLTYQELNERANQLANQLREKYHNTFGKPFEPDTLVGLYLDRSLETVISILAVQKAGGAYVPIAPDYPKERIQFLLKDTQAFLVITQEKYADDLRAIEDVNPALIIANDFTELSNYPKVNLEPLSRSTDLAYVIYTSGTTGKPKGVMVTHTNAIHLATAQIDKFEAEDCQSALLFASYVFDASVSELFVSLFCGHRIYITSEEERKDVAKISQLIQGEKIELATIPPVMLSVIEQEELSSLKSLITAGEAPSLAVLEGFSKNSKVFNAYGPTESTVCASARLYKSGDIATNIGSPINNAKLYVLDDNQKMVPIGSPGELYVGGAGVTRGYLNQPELTTERFIENPFVTAEDQVKGYTRLYKTGDLVRWLPDGNLEFLGRNDFQVKIRGYRIELGEIEKVLEQLPEVNQAVVLDRERQGNKYLAAYIVSSTKETITSKELKEVLTNQLPEYMVPSTYTMMESIPLTINGKVDRKALPEGDFNESATAEYNPASNVIEMKLVVIWREVFSIAEMGIDDNFFDLGGQSILAISVANKIKKAFTLSNFPLANIFKYPTIKQLASLIQDTDGSEPLLAGGHILDLQTGGSKSPVFFAPGGNGTSDYVTDLAEAFAPDHSFYGFQMQGSLGDETPFETVEEVAKENIKWMKEVEPTGPYILMGHSTGAWIIIEMARILEEIGESVENVFILDNSPLKKNSPAENAMYFVGMIEGFYETKLKQVLDFPRQWKEGLVRKILLEAQSFEASWDILLEFLKEQNSVHKDLLRLKPVFRMYHANIYLKHTPKEKVKNKLVLVKAKESNWSEYSEDLGWKELADEIEIVVTKGSHTSIVSGEYAKQLVEKVKQLGQLKEGKGIVS